METQETPEQIRIRELESQVFLMQQNINELELINIKLGYSTRLMSEFHLTLEDRDNIANSIDLATNANEVESVYNEYKKMMFNKSLKEGMEEFQMSPSFKENIFSYLIVSLGEDPIEKIGNDIKIVSDYFSFENKIRSTPDAGHRQAMTDKLLEKRAGTIEALNRIIDVVNSLWGKNEETVE
ncbi:MAG: hypothetical protein AABY15_07190 [Nanoarchaeota archaeon]